MTNNRTSLLLSLLLLVAAAGMAWLAWSTAARPKITIEWSTATELNTAGFNLYRAEGEGLEQMKINATLIPASVDPLQGGDYTFADSDVSPGASYFYRLEEVEFSGTVIDHGTTSASAPQGGILEGAAAAILLGASAYIYLSERRTEARRDPQANPPET